MIFDTVESFQNKNLFYSGCKKFCVAQKSFSISIKLNEINVKEKAKSISSFDINTLYTTITHKPFLNGLSEVISFILKYKVIKRIGIFKTSI